MTDDETLLHDVGETALPVMPTKTTDAATTTDNVAPKVEDDEAKHRPKPTLHFPRLVRRTSNGIERYLRATLEYSAGLCSLVV
jgi:hypothetical protein